MIRKSEEPGRNDPCPCGSGKKHKVCCLEKPVFGEGEMRQLLHILLSIVKGINIPQDTFDNYPKDAKVHAKYIEETKTWQIWPENPAKPGLQVPSRKIIT